MYYLNKLPKHLSPEEQQLLFQELANGSKEARDKLLEHNLRLVVSEVYNKFGNCNYDKEDLISIGSMGLLKAIDTYDLSKNVKFSSYAIRCIDNEILMLLRKIKKDQNVDSIDRVIFRDKDGSEIKLEESLTDGNDITEEHEKAEIYKAIRTLVENLPDREREIIMLHFGFYDNKIYTQKEIAARFHISQSYVARVLKKIEAILQYQLTNYGVVGIQRNRKNKKEVSSKRIQSIYDYFSAYTKKQVDMVISKLTDEERALLKLRYGEDLENPIQSRLTKEYSYKFYYTLLKKMKELLATADDHEKENNKPKAKQQSQNVKKIKKKESSKMPKKLQSIYEYLHDYSKEQIDIVISKLTDEERALLTLRYGNDLTNPVSGTLTKKQANSFYNVLIPKMKKLLRILKEQQKEAKFEESPVISSMPTETKQILENDIIKNSSLTIPKEQSKVITAPLDVQQPKEGELILKTEPVNEDVNKNITKIDCVKMLELLRTSAFTQMMSLLSAKEAIIISLKLGYVDGKYFSTEAIASFFEIEESEVIEITKKVLLLYKENINSFLDNIIEVDQVGQSRELSITLTSK